MKAPPLWIAVPAFYLSVYLVLWVVFMFTSTPPVTFGQHTYFVGWLLWMSHANAVLPAWHGYIPLPSTIRWLCILLPALVLSVIFLKGWYRVSAVLLILFVWTAHGIALIGATV